MFLLVDCKLSDWNEWRSCSKSCGVGSRSRNRTILVPPQNEGQQCGSTFDIMECNEELCPGIRKEYSESLSFFHTYYNWFNAIKRLMIMVLSVDCLMGEWKEWNTCTKSCGTGTKSRVRSILVEPAFGGKKCSPTIDTADCNINSCSGRLLKIFSCINATIKNLFISNDFRLYH